MFGGSKGSSKSSSSSKGSPQIPQQQQQENDLDDGIQDIDMGQIDKMLKKDIKEEEIQLTDADMDDPELLSQLSAIESGSKLEKPKVQPQQVAKPIAKPVAQPAKRQLTKEEEEEMLLEREFGGQMNDLEDDTESTIADLEERKEGYKRLALASSKSGDKTKAVVYMKSVKELDNAINELKEGVPVDTDSLPPPPQSIQQQTPQPQSTPKQAASVKSTPSTSSLSSPSSTTSSTNSLTFSSPRPSSASNTPQIRTPPKVEILSKEKVEQEERNQTWELFEEEFKTKHHFLTTEAVKMKNIDKVKAISLLKESHGVRAILDQIEICKQASMKPPPFHFEQKVTQEEIIMGHLKDTEVELLIGKIELPKGAGQIDTYATGEFQYPTPEQPQKFQTPTVSASTNNYNFKTVFQVERKKGLERLLEKKKLTINIMSSKMFFMKSVVGRVDIKLLDLLTKCEIIERAPIMKEGSKKDIVGYLEVAIRMRTPLKNKEIKKSTERVLVLDGPIGNKSTESSSTTTTTSTSTISTTTTSTTTAQPSTTKSNENNTNTNTNNNNTAPVKPPQPTSTNNISQNVPVSADTTKTQPASTPSPAEKEKEEEEEIDIYDLSLIVSNDVLESMLNTVNQQILQQGAKPELLDQKQAIEIKVMVLETQVSSGLLSVEDYCKQLQEAIVRDKQLAGKLSKSGKKDLAIKVMARIKMMNAELESANEG